MKNKGFSLVELVISITILSIIMLIAVPAFAQIVERVKVRSDKASASEIGKAFVIREELVPIEERIQAYPIITRCDSISGIEEYISKEHIPQSIKGGYYFVTSVEVDKVKKILVGIGKDGMTVGNTVYISPEEAGWAFAQSWEINTFLKEHGDLLNEIISMPFEE